MLLFLTNEVYWKGIYFAPWNTSDTQSSLHLENVDIVNAVEGIKALKKAPELSNVIITDSGSGLVVEHLEIPLKISDSKFLRCKLAGINITSCGGPVEIQNVTVQNTTGGDGFVFKQLPTLFDFCSINPEEANFPLVLNASGRTVCSKVRK